MADQVDVAVATVKKNKIVKKAATDSNGKLTYSAMVTKAITNLKEKKGSSRHAIMQYISAEYKVDPASGKSLMNKTLAKMAKSGRLVPGAQAGRSGAGSYKLSAEEKIAIKKREKVEAKKQAGAVKKVNKKIAGEVTAVKKKVVKKSAGMKKVVAKKSGGKAKKVANAKVGAKVKGEVTVNLACVCGNNELSASMEIECDYCLKWFHTDCVQLNSFVNRFPFCLTKGSELEGDELDWFCSACIEEAVNNPDMTKNFTVFKSGEKVKKTSKAIIGAKAKKKLSAKPKKVDKKAVVKKSKK